MSNFDLYMLGFALAASLLSNILILVHHSKVRGLVQQGIDDAAKNRYSRVRLSIQSVLDAGFRPRTIDIWEDGQFRHPDEFKCKPGGKHPALRR
jgi:hypothetical protein